MEDIARFATKILVMNKAKIYTYDTVENVFSKSEEISHMGLSIPQITQVFTDLHQRGFNVNSNIYTVDSAVQELLPLLKGTRE